MLSMYPDSSQDYLERLSKNADRLYTLISDLLDVTRIEIGMLKLAKDDFNLIDITREAVNDIKRRTHLSTKNNARIKVKPKIKLIHPSHPIIIHDNNGLNKAGC